MLDFCHYFYGSSATKLPNSSLAGLKQPCWVVSHVNNSMKSHSCPLQERELEFLFSWHISTSINGAKGVLHLFQKQLLCFINDDITQVEVWRVACFYNSFSLPCCCSCMLMQPTNSVDPKGWLSSSWYENNCWHTDCTFDPMMLSWLPNTKKWIVFAFDTINTRF